MDKRLAARMLREIARMLELDGENAFKIRAYDEAADAVAALEGDLGEAVRSGTISQVRGIGKAIQEKLAAFGSTGSIPLYRTLTEKYPASLRELLAVPGLGPKKVRAVFDALGVTTLDQLEEAGRSGRLAGVKGFGARTQDKVLRGIAFYRASRGKFLLADAGEVARDVRAGLCADPSVIRCELAGSLRRRKEVVKDIDLVAASAAPDRVIEAFTTLPGVAEITGKGSTKASVRLAGGMAADLRVVTAEQFPFALLHFTGSAEHNTLLRGRAKTLGLRLNEYGLFREAGDGAIACEDEAAIYRALGFDFIAPELREGTGWEIARAQAHALPDLIRREDIRGVFHVHTTDSDGHATVAEMVAQARRLGLEYIGISDHSKAAVYANGLDDARLATQHTAIDELNTRLSGIRVLKGVEADILRDGQIDMDPATLAGCDFVVASIHSRFSETPETMTDRICKALANPRVTMLGHVSGRLLLEREPYEFDYERLFATAAAHGTLIEINGNPQRLELDWRHLQRAKAAGVRFCINPDAHWTATISHVYCGVDVARKGGLEKGDVLNTRDLEGVLAYLAARRRKSPEAVE